MNYYSKLIVGLSLFGSHLAASNNHVPETQRLQSQVFTKLTEQLRTNVKADISGEIERLDQISIEQAQAKADSVHHTMSLFGAAAFGAMLTKATQSSLPYTRASYMVVSDDATSSLPSRFITGLEIPALLSTVSIAKVGFGVLASGAVVAVAAHYIHKAIHAPCEKHLEMEQYKSGHQLKILREERSKDIAENKRRETAFHEQVAQLKRENALIAGALQYIKDNQGGILSAITDGHRVIQQNQSVLQRDIRAIKDTSETQRSSAAALPAKSFGEAVQVETVRPLLPTSGSLTRAVNPMQQHIIADPSASCCLPWLTRKAKPKPIELR